MILMFLVIWFSGILQLKFLTRIYHCNISSRGIVRMGIFSRWSSSYTISNILEDLIKLLCHCIPGKFSVCVSFSYNF